MRYLFLLFCASFVWGQPAITGPSNCQQGAVCKYTVSGGTPPYTFSLVNGSVGSLDPASGAYTAPSHVVPHQAANGCQVLPNNNIFNTRIDNLPVHPKSDLWMSNVNKGTISFGSTQRLEQSVVLSTDPGTDMYFAYTPSENGTFVFQPFPYTLGQVAAGLTAPGILPGMDNHILTTYRDTCQEQDVYQKFDYGSGPYPGTNSQSGAIFDLKSNRVPGVGTDAAGLPFGPLILHQSEFLSAAAGNMDAFQHAWRLTLDAQSVDAGNWVWPAQNSAAGGDFCQGPLSGGFTWTITANGTTAVTPASNQLFRAGWPVGMTVTIDSTNYTVVSVASDGSSMVVSAALPTGSHSMTTPEANCVPYGSRFRLKPSVTVSTYYPGCSPTCQNIVQAIVRQQKLYGLVLADVGSDWDTDADGSSYLTYDMQQAWETLRCFKLGCGFDGLLGNAANYEIVDESSLQTNQTQDGLDPTWMEAKINNGYVTPDGAAVIQVTDSAANKAYYSVALQGVAVGIQHPNEVVMAGAAPFQLMPWVTGSSNTSYTCSLSPSGGAYGTITTGCLYTPAPASAVTTLVTTTVTVTAAADNLVSKTICIQIIPPSSDGLLHISLGKPSTLSTYTDTNGVVWWNDMAQSLPMTLFPDENAISPYPATWLDYPGTNAYAASSPSIYNDGLMSGYNDHHFYIHVPNGIVTGTVLPANLGATSTGIVGFSLDCNGAIAIPQTDQFTYTGGPHIGRPASCSQVVTDGMLHMVLRNQGVSYGAHYPCTGNCYAPSSTSYSNLVAGLTVGVATPPTYVKKTICASGCDYLLAANQLYQAMEDAAAYQDGTACIPYIIEGAGIVPMNNNIYFPQKQCAQYVEIRSASGSHFAPGQRYNPSTDDAYAFGLQGLNYGAMIYVATNTRYWRFRNVNFFTAIKQGDSYPVTAASWSIGTGVCAGGCETLTIGPHASLLNSMIAVNGLSPAGYNFGNTYIAAENTNTISIALSSNPGTYLAGGTVQPIIGGAYSSFVQYGDNRDLNVWPSYLDIVQSSMHGNGVGEVFKGINYWGSHLRIADSYIGNISQLGSDADAIAVYGHGILDVRNSYLSAVDEDFIAGGTLMAGGVLPSFLKFAGNQITKESWMNRTHGNGAPNKPCYQGNWYHDDQGNQDYLCSATSGVWNLQSALLPYIIRYPKNVWECKVCLGVRLQGNDMGPMPAQATQDPSFIQLELVTQPTITCASDCPQPYNMQAQPWTTIGDVLVEGNNMHDGFTPLILGYSYFLPCTDGPQPCYNYAHHNITFRNNLIPNVSDERNYCTSFNLGTYCNVATGCGLSCGALGLLRLNDGSFDIDVSHNTQTTSIFTPNSGLMYGVGSSGRGVPTNTGMLSVRDNIFQQGVNGFAGYGTPGGNGCGLMGMVTPLGGGLDLNTNLITQESPTGQPWETYQSGPVTPGCSTFVWPTNHAGGMSWTSILDPNTYRVKSSSGYQGWGTDHRDPGADISQVSWRTAHAVDGAPAPALDFAIRSIIPTSTGTSRGVQIHFTAVDTTACSWELSTDPNLYTAPIAVSSQVRNGRDGVAIWNDGALSPDTAYWARVTCSGNQLEELINGSRAVVITAP
jgi:hypothetical protein